MREIEKILEPVQSIVHETMYNVIFLYVLYKIYNSNENNIVKYSHIIVLSLAIYTHLKRLFKNKEKIVKYTYENKKQVVLEIIKYCIILYVLLNLDKFCNFNIILLMGAFIDFLLYNRTFENGLFRKFITFEDKYIIFFIVLLLFLNNKYKVKNKYFHLIYYDLFYHVIELVVTNLL